MTTSKHKRKRRKHNATGRSAGAERFVKLDHYVLKSAAYRSLGCAARAVYTELRFRFNGSNNGQIALSVRDAARELHLAKDTATKAFRELQAKGFVRANQRGDFNWKQRHATTWILTEEKFGDSLPTREFMRWQPENSETGPKSGTRSPERGTKRGGNVDQNGATVLNQGPKSIN